MEAGGIEPQRELNRRVLQRNAGVAERSGIMLSSAESR